MTMTTAISIPSPSQPHRDTSGYEVFSAGDVGAAHAMAHRMLDRGRPHVGHHQLGRWLAGRRGTGSQWTHVQWHMLVFELAVGRTGDAQRRLQRHIMPAAIGAPIALTDAPSALWRIAIATGDEATLPWHTVGDIARRALWTTTDRYVTLHNLLALAGAGDADTIDAWLSAHVPASYEDLVLSSLGLGLRCLARGDHDLAAKALAAPVWEVSCLGGSRAQNELFPSIYRLALARAGRHRPTPVAQFTAR